MAWYLRPVLLEHLVAVGVDLDLADGGHPGALETQVDPTDSGEQGQHVHRVCAPFAATREDVDRFCNFMNAVIRV